MAASKDDAKATDSRIAWLEARIRETYKHVKVSPHLPSAAPEWRGASAWRRGPTSAPSASERSSLLPLDRP